MSGIGSAYLELHYCMLSMLQLHNLHGCPAVTEGVIPFHSLLLVQLSSVLPAAPSDDKQDVSALTVITMNKTPPLMQVHHCCDVTH